jgi:DNA mismatch endonuclease (patch repair protein)
MERALRARLRAGKFHNVSASRSRMMAAVRGKRNKTTEMKIRFAMVRAGVCGWHLHSPGLPGRPDFYFAKHRIAVFTDGCFWHGCAACGHLPTSNAEFWAEKIKRNQTRDKRVNEELVKMGVRVIRFWEHEIIDHCTQCVQRISEELRKQARIK